MNFIDTLTYPYLMDFFSTINQTVMKISIELTEAEVKGIKAYLKEVDGVKVDKAYLQQYIQGIVSSALSAPQEAVSDYINQFNK